MVTHNTVTASSATADFFAVAARDALKKIAEHSGQLGKLVRDDWRNYGHQLLAKRNELGGNDKAFGQWVKDNGLDAPPAQNPGVRSDAMWLARHWEQVVQFYLTHACKDNTDHHPTHIRSACRAAGMEWAIKQADMKKPPSVGWIEAVTPRLTEDAKGYIWQRARAIDHTKKNELELEYGQPIPSRIADDETVITKLVAAIERCAVRHNKDAVRTRIDEESAVLAAEVRTLPERAQAKLERLLAKQAKVQEQSMVLEVERRVTIELDKRMADERRQIANQKASSLLALQSANERLRESELRMKTFDAWMTQEEFKIVLGCLHPDRQPEDQRPKYDRAFQIFNRLQQHMSPSARTLKANGWK
jgi:hypothetical protein